MNPNGAANTPTYLTGLGRWNTENAVPLPKEAYSGKTVMVIGDDDSGQYGGQIALYVTNTVGDLDNGSIYVLARTNDVTRERDMVIGQQYPVVFRQIDGHKTLTGRADQREERRPQGCAVRSRRGHRLSQGRYRA